MKRAAFLVCPCWSRQIIFHFLLLILLGLAGCYAPGHSRISSSVAPLDESVRSSFGRVGILLVDRGPTFNFKYPKSTADATVDIAESTWKSGDYDDGVGDFVAGLVFSGTVGLIGGAVAGVPQSAIVEAEELMREALRQQPVVAEISGRIQTCFDQRGQPAPIVIPAELATNLVATTLDERDYSTLSPLGIDSVMEIAVDWHGFATTDQGNPPMSMEANVWVNITRMSDKAVLFTSPVHYHGHQHRFRCWASEDARRFRSELRRIGRMVGQSVVEQVFGPTLAVANR